jgi:S1-C subfamily serine protease
LRKEGVVRRRISHLLIIVSFVALVSFSFLPRISAKFPDLKNLKERNVCLEMVGFEFLSGLKLTSSGHYNGKGLECYEGTFYGSGFLVDDDGTILTNYHVAKRSMGGRAIFADGSSYEIKHIKVYDPYNDIAVLKIKGDKKFITVKLGDSDKIDVMDKVLAVGNTLGEGFHVSEGMINHIKQDDNDDRFRITHSATMAPGNSGGALYKDDRVIGINVAIHSHWQEIHYAIPINLAKALLKYDRTILFKDAFPTPNEPEKMGKKLEQVWAKVSEVPAAPEGSQGYVTIVGIIDGLQDYLIELEAEEGRDLAVEVYDYQNKVIGFSDYRNTNTEHLFLSKYNTQEVYVNILNYDNTPAKCAIRLYKFKW